MSLKKLVIAFWIIALSSCGSVPERPEPFECVYSFMWRTMFCHEPGNKDAVEYPLDHPYLEAGVLRSLESHIEQENYIKDLQNAVRRK